MNLLHRITCRQFQLASNGTKSILARFRKPLLSTVLVGLVAAIGFPAGAQQSLYVANENSDTIEEFNSSGVGTLFASNVSGDLDNPEGLAFGQSSSQSPGTPEPGGLGLLAGLGLASLGMLIHRKRKQRDLPLVR